MESFGALLQQHFSLEDEDLAEKLREVCQSVRSTNKAGTLTVTIQVEPNGDNRILIKVPTINVKTPQPSRGSAIFFLDEAGHISRRDPRQRSFDEMERN